MVTHQTEIQHFGLMLCGQIQDNKNVFWTVPTLEGVSAWSRISFTSHDINSVPEF